MKKTSVSDRYCQKLGRMLKKVENKENIVSDCKKYLTDQADIYIRSGIKPKKAEFCAVEALGPVHRMAAHIKKAPADSQSAFSEYISGLKIRPGRRFPAFYKLFYPLLILLYNSALWIFVHIVELAFHMPIGLLYALTGLCTVGITVFSLWLHCRDTYRPFYCLFNLISLAVSIAAATVLYGFCELFFFYYGLYFQDNFFTPVYYVLPVYISVKAVFAVIILLIAQRHRRDGDGRIFAILLLIGAYASAPAAALKIPFVFIYYGLYFWYTAAASAYITLYCKSKYLTRLALQCFGVVTAAELAAFATAAFGAAPGM